MVQTPTQRKANVKFAKFQENKMGKPESEIRRNVKAVKPTISPFWLIILGFIIFGGLIFEALSRFFLK